MGSDGEENSNWLFLIPSCLTLDDDSQKTYNIMTTCSHKHTI